ncbi:MAG TPA: metallophosphoesterase [Firmicutes bacterium]|nr:metallophosphoesterase [Bacillota bacterium]
MRSLNKRARAVALLTALSSVLILGLMGNNWIEVSHYQVSVKSLPRALDGLKIVHLSDLHGKTFGRANSVLANLILAENPDLVVCSGDMVDALDADGSGFISLVRALAGRCPVYYVLGNHELALREREDTRAAYQAVAREAGRLRVTLLENSAAVLERGEARLAIYGLTYPSGQGVTFGSGPANAGLSVQFIRDSVGNPPEDIPVILISHDPKWFEVYAAWGADLVLCGHLHGGIIRVPGKGGLLSPDRILFPKCDAGLYSMGSSTMHVSRGLGISGIPFRIFNRPDLSVITLRSES